MKKILPAIILAVLSGCAPAVYVAQKPQAVGGQSRFATDMDVCVFWGKRGINTDDWLEEKFKEGQEEFFHSVQGVPGLEDATGCDLAVKVTIPRKKAWAAEVYSAYSKQSLLTLETATSAGNAFMTMLKTQGSVMYDTEAPKRLGLAVFQNLTKDSEAYKQVLQEREAHLAKKKQEDSAKALASGKMSKDDIKALTEALSGGSAPKAEKKEPVKSSDIDSPRYKLASRPDDFAIVVGIEKYSSLPPASYGERDAATVKQHLLAQGYSERNIVLLSGSQATLTGMKKYLEEWLPRNVKKESGIFFYFSGHGAPDVSTQQAYLVPWDGDANFLESTAYPVKKLYAQLAALPVENVLVAVDACFSGAGGRSVLAKGARPLVMKVDADMQTRDKLTIFSAAESTQITSALDEEGHGIFTYYFLKGIGGEAKDTS
ncbi:MAG: caspase family protein, partial [Elusimicrobiota bacterium]